MSQGIENMKYKKGIIRLKIGDEVVDASTD